MILRAIVVDDEPLARQRVERLLNKLGVSVVAQGDNGERAIELAKTYQSDLLFLDINMPIKNGLAAAREIVKLEQSPAIIFCTAYDEFAIEAFNSSATAYLLKPITEEDLRRALDKAKQVSQMQMHALLNNFNDADAIVIKYANHQNRKLISKILYFRSCDKHVVAGMIGQGEAVVDYTLKRLAAKLGEGFVRTHNSSLLNTRYLSKLIRIDNGLAHVRLRECDRVFPVSRRHLAAVKKYFQ